MKNSYQKYIDLVEKAIRLTPTKRSIEVGVKTPKTSKETSERLPVMILDPNDEIIELNISQSLIKEMFFKGDKKEYCPKRLYHTTIIKDIPREETLAMSKGNFFETLVLGSSANGGQTLDLPRKKNNEKTIDQVRIEEQIDMFPEICKRYGIIIIKDGVNCNVQRKFRKEIELDRNFKIFLTMTWDIITPYKYGEIAKDAAIVDIKLTKTVHSDYQPYCWGMPHMMDHIQAFVYSFASGLPFAYLVFDYKSTEREHKFIPVNTDVNHPDRKKAKEALARKTEMFEVIRKACTDIETYHRVGWHTEPNYYNCKDCPILDCVDKNKNQEI